MDFEGMLKHLSTYLDIYLYVGKDQRKLEEIKDYLMYNCDKAESTARSYINMLKDQDNNGLFEYDEESNEVSISEWMLGELLKCLDGNFNFRTYDTVAADLYDVKDELTKLKRENTKLRKELNQEKEYSHGLEEHYVFKQRALEGQLAKAEEMLYTASSSQKVLVLSNVEIGPTEIGFYKDDQFTFKDRHPTIDERLMTLDSYLKEIPEKEGLEGERELSAENLRFYQMRHVFSEKIREGLIKNLGPFKGGYFHRHPQYQGLSIPKLLEMKDMTNSERLALYVMFADKMPVEKRELIECAAEEGLDADLVIRILEDNAVSKDTKERFWSVLKIIKSDSEYLQRERFARELLEQKWYIMSDYGGTDEEFQLVPVDEIKHLHDQVKQLTKANNREPLFTRESMRKEDSDNE